MKRTVFCILVGLFTLGFLGCGDDGGDMPGQISLAPQGAVIKVGEDVTLTAKQDNMPVSGGTWTTSDQAIATVTPGTNGTATVHGVAAGSATIKVMVGTMSAQVTVMVSEAALTGIEVTPAAPSFALGTTTQLTATATFDDGSMMDVSSMATWTSDTETVATVDTDGTVDSVSTGTATITAELSGESGTATVTVTDAQLVSATLIPNAPTIADGLTVQMTVTGHFSDDTDQDITADVTWASATETVATVDANGLVTAVDPGTSVISADVPSGPTLMTTVTVGPKELVSIDVTPDAPMVDVGATVQLTATATYTDASNDDVTATATWTSMDVNTATVTAGLVTGVAAGSTDITATIGAVSGSETVTVNVATVAPMVTATSPADASTDQSALSAIEVTFDQAMNPATLTVQATAGACTGSIQVSSDDFTTCIGLGAPALSSGDTVATTTPAPALAYGTIYKIRVTTSAQSAAAVALAADFTQATGFTTGTAAPCATGLVISQLYGAGGNNNAIFNADYIELHNSTNAAINLDGYAVQYASANGTTWNPRALPNVSLQAGGYFLIQMSTPSGSSDGVPLPTPDLVPTEQLMSGTSAKVALTSTVTALPADMCPTGASVVDFAAYGSTNCAEGSGAMGGLSATTAGLRNNNGCADTNDNSVDFTIDAPAPRNSEAANDHICACTANETNSPAELDFCSLMTPTSTSPTTGTMTEALFGKVYEMTVTDAAGAAANLQAEIGYGPTTANPENEAGWSWFAMTFDSQTDNDDTYTGSFTAPAAGTYAYASRFSLDGTNWTYCDSDGAGSNDPAHVFDPAKLGVLTVTP